MTEYYQVRDLMAVGDGISFKGTGFISDAISFFTGQERTHWSNVGDWVTFSGTQEHRLPLFEADQGEYNVRSLSKKLMSYEGEAYWHQLKSEFSGWRINMWRKMWEMVGIKYDYKALFANILGRQPVDTKELFCSEAGGIIVLEISHIDLLKYINDPYLTILLNGEALRPGGMTMLPIWEREVRLV
ncbi:MAG: hypothetical protein ACTSYF_10245 [Promethearchaeota archaeon]